MKVLQWHCDYFRYKTTKLALKTELEPANEGSFENVVVLLVSVEKNDNPDTARNAIAVIKPNFDQVKADKLLIYPYAHLSNDLGPLSMAVTVLKEMEMYAREKGFDVARAPFGWYKEFEVKVKGHPMSELSKNI